MPPRAPEAHYRRQARLAVLAVRRAAAAWESGSLVQLTSAIALLQYAAARDADGYLDEFDDDAVGRVQPLAFAGVAGDGRPLDTLWPEAESQRLIQVMAATAVQDAGRAAVAAGIAARPAVTGYVRMLNPPSCSRCAVLAGRWYKWNAGFARHPSCDCRAIPAAEDRSGDLRTDPEAAVRAGQVTGLSRADTQAILDGADMGQVVNARRGMETAQVLGRRLSVTTEGTTVRGLSGQRLARQGTQRLPGSRYRSAVTPRLRPESIYQIAGADREEAIRLLRRFGYII